MNATQQANDELAEFDRETLYARYRTARGHRRAYLLGQYVTLCLLDGVEIPQAAQADINKLSFPPFALE